MSVRYFEDLSVGEVREFGGRTVTKSAILSFAEKYDPQPFHLDEHAAEESLFGALVASGWQTVCLLNRMVIDGFICETANMGGWGVDNVRWHRPLRPGTTLSGRIEILSKQRSSHHPKRGDVQYEFTAFDQNDDELLSMTANLIVRCRSDP